MRGMNIQWKILEREIIATILKNIVKDNRWVNKWILEKYIFYLICRYFTKITELLAEQTLKFWSKFDFFKMPEFGFIVLWAWKTKEGFYV